MLPNALAVGVPYSLFWHLTPRKLNSFYEAYKIRLNEKDTLNWQLGQYICAAISTVFKGSYPKKPSFQLVDAEKKGNSQSNEEIAVFEMKKRTKQLQKLGLMESPS